MRQSLAMRIIAVSLGFLVLPLIFLSVIMYDHEYQLKKESNFLALRVLADEVAELVHTYTIFDRDIVEMVEYSLNLGELQDERLPSKKYNDYFTSVAKIDQISEILYVTRASDGRFFCTISSDQKRIREDMSALLQGHTDEGYFFYQFPGDIERSFVFVKPLYFSATETIKGMVVLITKGGRLAQIQASAQFAYPISASLVSRGGEILFSTREALVGQHLVKGEEKTGAITLFPENKQGYSFSFNGQKRMGVYIPIPQDNVDLFVEMSSHVNLISLKSYLARVVVVFFVILIGGGLGTLWVTIRMARPLKQLAVVMNSVKEGDFSKRFSYDPMGFEINFVGTACNNMIDSIVEYIHEVKQQRFKKELLAKELLIGQEVQRSLLPRSLPQMEGVQVASGYMSAKEVSGDFYDIFPRDAHSLFLTIADASGKGIYACLYSLMLRSILRSNSGLNDLAEVVKRANNLFMKDTSESCAFVTAWTAFFDTETKTLLFSNCGHYPAILLRQGGAIEMLTTPGMAFGVEPFGSISVLEKKLHPGDVLVLYTDGIIDAQNSEGALFGEERLKQAIADHQTLSAQEISEAILRAVGSHAKGVTQYDDITLLIVKATG